MKIGIDFGTTNSAVCYLDEHQEPQAMSFGGAQGGNYSPSCVAFPTSQGDNTYIGRNALHKLGMKNYQVYSNFKLLLGERDAGKRAKWGYTDRTPDEIAEIYFRHLLDTVHESRGQVPDTVVVTIPEVWRKALLSKSESLVAVCKKSGIKHVQLESEPIAASAYFLHRFRKINKRPFTGHVLVCDCGGGTLDFCVASVETGPSGKDIITPRYRTGNGLVGASLGKAGVAYDEAVTDALFPGLRASDTAKFYKRFYEFEQQKRDCVAEYSLHIRRYLKVPSAEQAAFNAVEGVGVTAKLLCETFDRVVKPGLLQALDDVRAYLTEQRIDIENPGQFRVLPVGGFSAFEPVMRTIKDYFDSFAATDERFETCLFADDTQLAIAKGAVLVAEEQVKINTLCPVTLGIYISKVEAGEVKVNPEPILTEGKVLSAYHQPTTWPGKLASTPGSAIPFTIYLKEGKQESRLGMNLKIGDILPETYVQKAGEDYLRCGFSVDENMVFTFHAFHYAKNDQLKGKKDTSLGKIINLLSGFRDAS